VMDTDKCHMDDASSQTYTIQGFVFSKVNK
jgi:hypothetical protein